MRRPSISIRVVSAFALLGLILGSTVVAWARPCADECSAAKAAHACCAPGLDPVDDASFNDPGCCGGTQMRCAQAQMYEPTLSSAVQERAHHVALEPRPVLQPAAEPLVRTLPRPRAGPPGPIPLPTKTIVLLL